MGTEVAISFSSLRTQLENEKSTLYKIDANIKKIVQTSGRFPNERFHASGDYNRGGARPSTRNSYPDNGSFAKTDDGFGKRKHETKTVFSRLSARTGDSDGENESMGAVKRMRMPSAVSRELPTRAAVLQAQAGDEAARTRNRRMFGSLLGTLQKFKQEEITLHSKEEKKAQVERKIEEQARLEKERNQEQRKTLFAEREQRKARIKALEAKMGRVGEFERWESSQRHLAGFILTRAKPHLYWLPKVMSDKAQAKLHHSRKFHEKCMSKKRVELQEELQRIEQRITSRGAGAAPGAAPGAPRNTSNESAARPDHGTPHPRKRDKFASDADRQDRADDSDHDDLHHDDKDTSEAKQNSMDQSEASIEPPPPGTEDISISPVIPERDTNGTRKHDDDDDHPDDSTEHSDADNDRENGPNTSELVQNELEHNEPECNEVVNNEPENDEMVQHESDHDEEVQNEPEQDEIAQNEPEKDEMVQNEPEKDEMVQDQPQQIQVIQNIVVLNELEQYHFDHSQ